MKLNIAIIGAGLIGRKRAKVISKDKHSTLKVICDISKEKAENLSFEFGGKAESNWHEVVRQNGIDVIVVSTFNKYLAPISIAALKNHKHALCEKPLGRNVREAKTMLEAAESSKRLLKTGFNHRFHPAVEKAKMLFDKGEIGDLCFLRCRYGHGGRIGYEKEWRANKHFCGGGELLDQGVHVLDLFRWFAGDFKEVFCYTSTYFWDMKVEDNAFAIFKNKNGVIATMHTSWTQWKNIFSYEIFGKNGYLIIEGLGGSYGKEILKIGRRNPNGGVPLEEIFEFKEDDVSWEKEWHEFISAIKEKRRPSGDAWDGYQVNKMIEAAYKSSKINKLVKIVQ